MLKFWLALILGTITIAAGLTYLKLHRGAQTITYPPPAPKVKMPLAEFLPDAPNNEGTKLEISANVVTFNVKESFVNNEYEVTCKLKNAGEGELELSLKEKSCTCAELYIDKRRITETDHLAKIAPGQTVQLKLIYKPKNDQLAKAPGEKSRVRAIFTHNDERFSDNLSLEILTEVKANKS